MCALLTLHQCDQDWDQLAKPQWLNPPTHGGYVELLTGNGTPSSKLGATAPTAQAGQAQMFPEESACFSRASYFTQLRWGD